MTDATNERDFAPVVRVVMTRTFKRDGSLKGYRYTAQLADGSDVVIRTASRPYERAYLYDTRVASGTKGLGGYFSYGKAPKSLFRLHLDGVYPVTDGDE